MEQTLRKTSVRIWDAALERFNERIKAALLRRDACLSAVLEQELDHLDAQARSNSEAAQQFIASSLETLPRKLVTLTLPETLMSRLDDICKRKRIVRDSFFNRLMFLLAADARLLEEVLFNNELDWHHRLTHDREFARALAARLVTPIPEFRNPFHAIRYISDTPEWSDPENPDGTEPNPCYGPDPIYWTEFNATTFANVDISGLNVFLSDDSIPGIAKRARAISFDDLRVGSKPSQERS